MTKGLLVSAMKKNLAVWLSRRFSLDQDKASLSSWVKLSTYNTFYIFVP